MRILLFILFFAGNLSAQYYHNSNFDFSAIPKFWHIVDILSQNREPSENEWNDLLNTPGYKVLTRKEFSKDFFIKNFRLAFKPSLKKELNKKLQSNDKESYYLHYYIKVKNNRERLKYQLNKLKSRSLNKEALDKTLRYLPVNSVSSFPPVAFVIFENNGRGSSPIVVDLQATLEWDFISFLAHEFHHFYRNKLTKLDFGSLSDKDAPLVEALIKVEAEGIADRVDKKKWFNSAYPQVSPYALSFKNEVNRTPLLIKKLNGLLGMIAENYSSRKTIGKEILNSIPQKGHPTGYYMATLIEEKLGRSELVKCVGNPFKFFITYNNAAKLGGNVYPSFSPKALRLLKELEQKYIK